MSKEHIVWRGRDGATISTNIEDFHWPTREEKIAGLLAAGLIDESEAERLRNQPTPPPRAQERRE